MIQAAGGKVVGDYPMYEGTHCFEDGLSVKILEPLTKDIPPGPHRIVWLDRNVREQARSEVKFLTAMGLKLTADMVGRIAVLHESERFKALDRLAMYGKILILSFEDLISKRTAVESLATFLEISDVDKMVEQIVPRSAECLPDLNIEMTLAERGPKS
jgi:hypothetical protein